MKPNARASPNHIFLYETRLCLLEWCSVATIFTMVKEIGRSHAYLN
jgi:hypothetical protein